MATKKPQPAYLASPQAFDMSAADEIFARASMPAQKQEQPKATNPLLRFVQDAAVSGVSGSIGALEFPVGVADLLTMGRAGKALESIGFRPKEGREIVEGWYTPEQQAANKKVQEADGFFGVAGEAISNPSVILQEGVKALPSMIGGQLIGRGLLRMAPKMSGATAAGAGEGVVIAGQQAEQIRQQTEDGLLTAKQSGLAGAAGVLGAVAGAYGNKLAGEMGLVDPDQAFMRMGQKSGAARAAIEPPSNSPPKGIVGRTIGGALAEGVAEEAPQSAIEQAAQNLALDRPVEEGVGGAVALGMLTGAAMGGGVAALSPGDQLREMKLPEVGPTTRALNAGVESAATTADATAAAVATAAAPPVQLSGPQILARAEQRVRDAGAIQTGTSAPTHTPAAGMDRGQQIMAEALRRADAARATQSEGGAAPTEWATSPGAASARDAQPGSIEFTQELPPDASGMTLAEGPMPRKPRGAPSQELRDAVWAARNLTLQPTDAEIEAQTARVGGEKAEVLTPLSPSNAPLLGMQAGFVPQPQIGLDRAPTGRMRAGSDGIQPEERWQKSSDEQRAAAEKQRREELGQQAPQPSPRQESPGTPGLSRMADPAKGAPSAQPDTSKVYKSLSIATRQARLAGSGYKAAPTPDGSGYAIQAIKAAALGGNQLARPVLPAVETKSAKDVREAAGDVVLRLPAPALLEVAKSADGKLDAGRIANIDAVVTSGRQLSGIPSVGLAVDGGVAVDDGRHRILYAATHGMDLDVRVPAQDAEAVKALVYAAPAAPQDEVVTKQGAEASRRAKVGQQAPVIVEKSVKPGKVVYRNPATGETWSGGGLKPKWITQALASGASLDDLRADAGPAVALKGAPVTMPQQVEKTESPAAPPDASAADWAGLGEMDREAVISKAGWAAPGGGLKPQARDWVGRKWGDIGTKARAKLGPALREHVAAKTTPAPAPARAAQINPSANTVFTDDAAERAREIIRSRLKVANNKQRGGIDPDLMAAGITLAGWHIEKGARKFAAYAKAMIEDMGEEVRPYLKSWYMGVKYDPRAAGFDGMDSAATVDAASVEDAKPISDAEIIAAYRKITQNPRNPMSMTEIGRLHREVGGSLSALHDSLKRMADNGRVYFVVGEPTAITQQERDAGIYVGGKRYYNVEITDQGPGKDEQTNERRGIQEQGSQTLGRVATSEGGRAEGAGSAGASAASGGQQRAEQGERVAGSGVPPARSTGGGTERVRAAAAGGRGERDTTRTRGRTVARADAPATPSSLIPKRLLSELRASKIDGGDGRDFSISHDDAGTRRVAATFSISKSGKVVAFKTHMTAGLRDELLNFAKGFSSEKTGALPKVTPKDAPGNIPAANFQITEDVHLGQGGEAEKFRDNLAAIRIIKTLERERRRATPEEQRTLARYVGWGGLANAFADDAGAFKAGWEKRGVELADLLTPDELAAARRTTRNAHYTSETIVRSMWDAVRRLGFRGGMVFESSMGTGNFLGLAPQDIGGKTHFVGVEYDSLTSRIAQALYPQATVLHSGLQKVPLPDGEFDLNIGNPPFGSESLRFQFKPELNGLSIHNQFFLAGLDALKPGGVQALVVSRYLLDAKDSTARKRIFTKAKLLGAIRLPDTAFKENARTDVVTDILFLQRRTPESEAAAREMVELNERRGALPQKEIQRFRELTATFKDEAGWVGTTSIPDPLGGEEMTVSGYFKANPGMVLGRMERSGSMRYEGDIAVKLPTGADFGAMLADVVRKLPENVMPTSASPAKTVAERHKTMSEALSTALEGLEPGSMVLASGRLQQVVERETPTGDYELSRRDITPNSPWSPSLMLDSAGRWYRLVVETDEKGDAVKNGRANVYKRETFATENDVPESLRLGKAAHERLVGMVGLRDILKRQLTLESKDAPARELEANRRTLKAAYDEFVSRHGFVNERSNAALVGEMPDGALVLALETSYRPEVTAAQAKKSGEAARRAAADPAPILLRRVVDPYTPPGTASSPADALAITMAEGGKVDVARIAGLLGVSEDEAIKQLATGNKPLVFKDPETQTWETRDAYLSGQVKRKLVAARAAGMDANVQALEEVQPEPWGADAVTAILGSTWVPREVYADFAAHLTGGRASVLFSPATNSFSITISNQTSKAQDWASEGVKVDWLLHKIMNSEPVRVTYTDAEGKVHVDTERTALAQLKAKQIQTEFSDWVFADGDRRRKLVEVFNEKFNTRVSRQFDGSHLILPGKVPDAVIGMRRHQKNAIWRGISQRFMLLDHVVGAGKTFTAIARAMERRRMGLSRKPTVVVPNHMVEQFTADIYRLYPGAKVLAAGKKDFEKSRRRRLFAKIATGDWDIVVIPHSSFGYIGISPETEERYLTQELALARQAIKDAEIEASAMGLSGGRSKPFNVKEAERLAEKIEGRLDALKKATRDTLLTFEQLGIDDLTVDEAHEFKNLFYSSRLSGVRGLNDKTGSQKAFDLYNKVRVLRESGGSVTFMTGTPISNSAVEMYTMMRYLAADDLRELGLEHFDAWRAQFVDVSTKFEPTESGRLKEVNRLGRNWSNMRALMDLYYSFTDAVTIDDIKKWYAEDNGGKQFPVPRVKGGGRQSVVVKPTPAQVKLLEEVLAGFDGLDDIKDPVERNAERLRLMDRARKVSLDVRAVDPRATSKEVGGKLDVVADNVARIHKKWDAHKGAQLVFLDRSVPKSKGDDTRIKEFDKLMAERAAALSKGDEPAYRRASEKLEKIDANEIEELRAAAAGGWNAYQQIKDNLIARGIPSGQIRFVQEANTDAQKQALFDAVNSGEVRVLLGSTPRMGAGTNVQKLLVALHHVDVTWKPSDIEQRDGRIIRQGNELLQQLGDAFEVEILAYATERTADAKMWDLNSTKLKTINGIRKYDGQFTMEFEDADAVGMAELAALASGDPKLLERVTLDSEISRLELEERAHARRLHGLRDRIDRAERDLRDLPGDIQKSTERAADMTERLDGMMAQAAGRSVEVEGSTYTSHFDAERAVMQAVDAQQAGDKAAKFAVKVGGSRRTSEAGIRAAIDEALGDVAPFAMRIGSEELKQRTEAARRLADSASKMIAALEGSKINPPTARVGEFLGLRLEMDVSRGAFGSGFDVSMTLVHPDTGLDAAMSEAKSETAIVSTQAMRGAIDRLLADARMSASYTSRFDERKLETARTELPDLKERAAQPFPKAQELKAKRERLEDLVRELAVGGASKPDAASTGEGLASRGAYIPPAGDTKASLRQIEMFARSVSSKWTGGPSGGVRVVRDASELDDALRDWVDAADPEGVAKGFYHPGSGTVYLIADRIDTIAQAQFVLFHEVYGHHGLRSVLGGEYASTMTSLGRANPELSRLAGDWMENYGTQEVEARVQFGADRTQAERDVRLLATEEALSDWATQTPEIGRLRFLVARVQRGLRAVGLGAVADWLEGKTSAETLDLLVRARRAVSEKGAKAPQQKGGHPTFSRPGAIASISQRDLQNTLADVFGSAGAKMNWWHKTLGTQWHKAQTFPEFRPVFDAVQGFYMGTSRLANEAADQAPHILPKLERARDLFRDGLPGLLRNGIPAADARAIAAPVFEGTLAWRRDGDGRLIRMSEGEDVSAAGVVFNDSELRDQFKLTEKQIGYYREFRAAVDASLDQAVAADVVRYLGDAATPAMRAMVESDRQGLRSAVGQALTQTISGLSSELNAIQDEITSLEDSGEGEGLGVRITELQSKRQKLQAKLQAAIEDRDRITEKYTRIDELKAKGYAPLMRFGKFAVKVAGPDGKSLFFSLHENRIEANRAAREMREQFADTPGAEVTQGVLSQQHHELFAGVPFEALEMFAGELGRKDDPAFQAWLKLAKNNRSALKRLIHRKGTAGFSNDAPRVLASFITSNARMASGAMHLDGAEKLTNEIEDGDVQDEAINLLKAVKNPAEVAMLGRGLLFANFIGGSIASAVVNLTQPITMTLPYLSQWGGGAVASKRLASAGAAVASGRTPEHLKDALKRAEDEGVVSPQEIHHLMAQASGSWRIPGGGAAQAALQKLALLWGGPFSLAEQFNRRVTFLAAYETALAERMGDPFAFAERTVLETQGLYNKGNSANWARNPVGAVALTFKQFSIHYLEWLVRMAKSGPQGRKAALMALALLAATGGAEGLPFVEDINDLVDTIAQALGYDFSFKRKKREFIADQLGLGDEWANVALRGFSAIPGVPMDVSLRMGMGNLIPATGLLLRSNTDRGRDTMEVAGAAGGLARQYIDGAEKLLAGDLPGAGVAVLPVALQNALKGFQMYSSGEYQDTKNRRVSDVDVLDAAMKGIGFQPQGIALESQKLGEVRRSIDLALRVESEIVGRLARAYIDKDQDAAVKARQDLANWNNQNPGARIAISPAQIAGRAREMRTTREERFVRTTPKEMRQEVLERMM